MRAAIGRGIANACSHAPECWQNNVAQRRRESRAKLPRRPQGPSRSSRRSLSRFPASESSTSSVANTISGASGPPTTGGNHPLPIRDMTCARSASRGASRRILRLTSASSLTRRSPIGRWPMISRWQRGESGKRLVTVFVPGASKRARSSLRWTRLVIKNRSRSTDCATAVGAVVAGTCCQRSARATDRSRALCLSLATKPHAVAHTKHSRRGEGTNVGSVYSQALGVKARGAELYMRLQAVTGISGICTGMRQGERRDALQSARRMRSGSSAYASVLLPVLRLRRRGGIWRR